MPQTMHTPEKDAEFMAKIRRHNSTEWASPQVSPDSGSRLFAARALGLTPSPPRPRRLPPEPASGWLPWAVVLLGLLVRHACSLHPYSGENSPPKYGDYEAHRHWMELTLHLPLAQWYTYQTDYWGLDYPPLMAYVERGLGLVSHWYDPVSVALDASRGYEGHRAFMRGSVLIMDALVAVSAFVALAWKLERSPKRRALLIALCLLAPAPILVDHGHFQYNCLPLGLTLWSALFVEDRPYLASFLFTLALHTKQTALYYAPAVFCELLGRTQFKIKRIAGLGAVVLLTTLLIWLPLLHAGAALPALRRCFPVARGVFEDKVGNAWYAAQVFLRMRDRCSQETLIKLAALFTCLACFVPCGLRCRRLLRKGDRSLPNVLRSLHVSALAFFLFSYHVHEKGILVPLYPLLPLSLLEREYLAAFSLLAGFTLLPLLHYEGLGLAYGAAQLPYVLAVSCDDAPAYALAAFACLVPLHAVPWLFPPPARYPDLYPALVALAGAAGFGLAYARAAWRVARPASRRKVA